MNIIYKESLREAASLTSDISPELISCANGLRFQYVASWGDSSNIHITYTQNIYILYLNSKEKILGPDKKKVWDPDWRWEGGRIFILFQDVCTKSCQTCFGEVAVIMVCSVCCYAHCSFFTFTVSIVISWTYLALGYTDLAANLSSHINIRTTVGV